MARRRNSDEPWRELWRQAGTGDLIAARRLVRALERAGQSVELIRTPLTPDQVGDRRSLSLLVTLSLGDSIPNLRDLLLTRSLGDDVASANLADFQAVDVTDTGEVVVRVDLDDVEARETGLTCVRCGTGTLAREVASSGEPLCDVCFDQEDECDDWCVMHDNNCDGGCSHRLPGHMNLCMSEAQNQRIRRERRASH